MRFVSKIHPESPLDCLVFLLNLMGAMSPSWSSPGSTCYAAFVLMIVPGWRNELLRFPPLPSSSSSLGLARQRPQQALGGGEEVDGRRTVCDEGGLQAQSLKQLHLWDRADWLKWLLTFLSVLS